MNYFIIDQGGRLVVMNYIWGVGFFYHNNIDNLKDYKIVGYIDNKLSKETYEYNGKPIISSDEITDDMEIIIMVKCFVPLVYELIERGVNKIKIGSWLFPESYQEILLRENGNFMVIDDSFVYKFGKETRVIRKQDDIVKLYKELIISNQIIENFVSMPEKPLCRDFGFSRGTPIDRVYIEKFLEQNKFAIKGDVLEIAENTYTMKYGEDRVDTSHVLHVNGWGENVICGNLETGEGITENRYDVAIITQTLMVIYNLPATVRNIHKLLKSGGVALITVSGISQISRYDAENWGSYWGFHPLAIKKLFEAEFSEDIVIESYGNVKTASALLWGISAEELPKEIFKYNDPQYPVILGIKVKKD